MTRVILVRHGETEWNAKRLAQGQADVPLNEVGIRQAHKIAHRLAEESLAAIYSSDLSRALDTAIAIAESSGGLQVGVDPDLREIDQGEWEGMDVREIAQRWPEHWGDARHWQRRPGGESPTEVRERGLAAVERAVAAHPSSTIVLVTHGGPIRWISAQVLGYDDMASARLRGVGNGGAVAFDACLQDGQLRLENLTRLDGKDSELDDPNQ
jgi:broad specificity phosphatase PhoE